MSSGSPQRLQALDPRKDIGNHAGDVQVGIRFAQPVAGAGNGSAGAHSGDEGVGRASGRLADLRQQLGAGAVIVRPPVLVVGILVAVPVALGLFGGQPLRFAQRVVVAFDGVGEDQFRTVRPDPLQALAAGIAGHDQRDGNVERGAQHGVGDARVARGGVQQPPVAVQAPVAQCRRQHAGDRAVLDGTAGIGALQLGEQPHAVGYFFKEVQFDQRGVADAGENACGTSRQGRRTPGSRCSRETPPRRRNSGIRGCGPA